MSRDQCPAAWLLRLVGGCQGDVDWMKMDGLPVQVYAITGKYALSWRYVARLVVTVNLMITFTAILYHSTKCKACSRPQHIDGIRRGHALMSFTSFGIVVCMFFYLSTANRSLSANDAPIISVSLSNSFFRCLPSGVLLKIEKIH